MNYFFITLCFSLFVSLVYCAESTVRWFVVREKHCWMAADCADKSKRTGRLFNGATCFIHLALPTFTAGFAALPRGSSCPPQRPHPASDISW
jgi:hypothetical protein